MVTRKRVGVIGLGAVGSMAFLSLARRGADVVGFDRFTPGHDDGAYGGHTRQLRLASHDGHGEQHIDLAEESLRLWRDLERESGQTLYIRTGQLAVGPARDPDIDSLIRCLEAAKLEHLVLTSTEVERRYPQHRLSEDEIGVYSIEAGVLRSNRSVVAAVQIAEGRGATVRMDAVTAVEPTGDGVRVTTGDQHHIFDAIVVTTGPWVGELLPQLRPTVTARRIVTTWFEPRPGMSFAPGAFPPGFRRSAAGYSYTFLPAIDRTAAKFIYWIPLRPAVDDPSSWDRSPDTDTVESTRIALSMTMPGAVATPSEARTYMEGFTPDRWPIVGQLSERITLLTGFSGSGFAISPVMGEIAADLVLEGRTNRDIANMAPGRRDGVPA